MTSLISLVKQSGLFQISPDAYQFDYVIQFNRMHFYNFSFAKLHGGCLWQPPCPVSIFQCFYFTCSVFSIFSFQFLYPSLSSTHWLCMNLLVISVIWSWVIMISFYMKRLNLQCVFFLFFLCLLISLIYMNSTVRHMHSLWLFHTFDGQFYFSIHSAFFLRLVFKCSLI